jgi:hypothetical protein
MVLQMYRERDPRWMGMGKQDSGLSTEWNVSGVGNVLAEYVGNRK